MSDEAERPAEADATEPEPEAAAEVEAEAEPELTLEELIEKLTGELAQARAELTYRDADIVNLRRRHTQERGDLIKFGGRALANRLLSVLDNLDRALEATPEGVDDSVVQGISLTRQSFCAALEAEGITVIEAAGKKFDPNLHEAITTLPASEEHPAGVVIDVLETGYMLHDRVLRPARVVVTSSD
ncbi:MAG: nucleotide exchange factor GrpE [Candidatus Poseidoniales archaeon]|nr:nucleotide exchange factor GrpE [Candidatus Poseidoniales archaeon]